jgi:hypothetical protein
MCSLRFGTCGMRKAETPPPSRLEGSGAADAGILLLEQLHRIDDCLDHAQRERNANEGPSQHEMQRGRAGLLI